jgi:hypothetical protein
MNMLVKKFLLKSLLLTASFCALTLQAMAQESVEGFVSRDSRGLTFITSNPSQSFQLKAATSTVNQQLRKLGNLDAIRGTGKVIGGKTLILDTIDFVGLHRILGTWASPKYLFNFKTFAEVTLYPTYPRIVPRIVPSEGEMKYTITPADGDTWKVFFSNPNQVILASLKMTSSQQAIMTFYDEETGSEKSSILLTKVRSKAISP